MEELLKLFGHQLMKEVH